MKVCANKQRGIGVVGLILIIAASLFVVVFGMKIVPAYLHNMQIERIFKVIVTDQEMQNATEKDIRASYTKRIEMDSITELAADNVEISKDGAHISLSANYSVKIPVAGNISLLVEFKPSAEK
jgi:hypothetical protein